MFKKSLITSALVFTAMGAQASSVVTIDPDGLGAGGAYSVSGLDWNANTVLVTPTGINVAGGVASGNAAVPNGGDVLQSYAQGALSAFNGDTGALAVSGLNSSFEWTFVAGFREVVSSFIGVPGNGTIVLDAINGGDNFFRLYRSAVNSNSLAGTGFNDGDLILSGSVSAYNAVTDRGTTTFTTKTNVEGALDQFGTTNNYPAIKSVSGQGSGSVDLVVNYFNSDYLTGLNIGSVMTLFLDTQLNDPFKQVNPSALMTKGDNTTIDAVSLASLGDVNGKTGPNFVLQSDATSTFNVPEPASIALSGLALAGLGLSRRRSSK